MEVSKKPHVGTVFATLNVDTQVVQTLIQEIKTIVQGIEIQTGTAIGEILLDMDRMKDEIAAMKEDTENSTTERTIYWQGQEIASLEAKLDVAQNNAITANHEVVKLRQYIDVFEAEIKRQKEHIAFVEKAAAKLQEEKYKLEAEYSALYDASTTASKQAGQSMYDTLYGEKDSYAYEAEIAELRTTIKVLSTLLANGT